MGADLRRMVALGPAGTMFPGSAQDLRAASTAGLFALTGTRWVRLWADWPTLQPAPGVTDPVRLAALDAQIMLAKAQGLSVMLTLYRFPTWVHGAAGLDGEALAATMADRRAPGQADFKGKSLHLRPPTDVSRASPWGAFVELLVGRYLTPEVPPLGASIDALEIANEPNLMWWPQQGPGTEGPFAAGAPRLPGLVARMFVTARGILDDYGGAPPILAGPGTADTTDDTRLRTPYAQFTEHLLDALHAEGFTPGADFAWTHHSYGDVTYDRGVGSTAPDAAIEPARAVNSAADVRRRLVGRWAGWPSGDATAPGLLLTEGGVTLDAVGRVWGLEDPAARRAKQAELLQRHFNRMYATPEGDGVGMTAVYLFYSDDRYDSGLCDPFDEGGAPRPACSAWGALPSHA
jgi:hypothetical protein